MDRCSLVLAQPETGRLHQVRRHFHHISHPIVGDVDHGSGETNRHYRARYGLHRLALHARSIEFDHPTTGERILASAPIPKTLPARSRRSAFWGTWEQTREPAGELRFPMPRLPNAWTPLRVPAHPPPLPLRPERASFSSCTGARRRSRPTQGALPPRASPTARSSSEVTRASRASRLPGARMCSRSSSSRSRTRSRSATPPILDGRPVVLIVPDGTWRQASKVKRRVPGLTGVPCVSVSGEARLRYRLRAEAHAHGLSTIEAIARAMGILEGERRAADARESLPVDGGADALDPRRARGDPCPRRNSRGDRPAQSARGLPARLTSPIDASPRPPRPSRGVADSPWCGACEPAACFLRYFCDFWDNE